MAVRHCAHSDAIDLLDRAHEKQRFDAMNAVAVGAERFIPDYESERNGVYSEDQGPFLRDDMQQVVDAVGFHRGDDRLVDRRDCAGMPARKRDQVLVRLFDDAKTFTQLRQRVVLEWDHSSHDAKLTPGTVNFLPPPPEKAS